MSSADNDDDSSPTANDLVYLLYRMGEPLHFPKGDHPTERRIFELSPDYIPNKFKGKAPQILTRFNADAETGRRVAIGGLLNDALLKIPLDQIKIVKRDHQFSLFIPQHRKAATRLLKIFMSLKSINDLIAFAGYSRDQINSQLFAYAFSTALLHRKDTKHLQLPSAAEIFPSKFFNTEVIADCKEVANIFNNPAERVPVEIPPNLTGNNSNAEHRMAYWREDLGLNLHHWHWHLLYPHDGPLVIVDKDRRGELFYYFHQQMLARYNIERLCNNLNLPHRLMNWDEPISEAYFPMLSSDIAGNGWAPRPENIELSNINRPDIQFRFDLEDMKRYRERILEAIHRKKVISLDGTEISIDNEQGIDILGNMVEASILSPNGDFYGDLHNMGHVALAYIHDPQYKHTELKGVMGDVSTSMRDPVFYRWHLFVNDIFQKHKNSLQPYNERILNFPGIQVKNVELQSYDKGKYRNEKNTLHTYMMKSDINISRGLDFAPKGPVLARVTHINHDKFVYTIDYLNTYRVQVWGTVRIFLMLSNEYDSDPLKLTEQRRWAIEMDRFVQPLTPGRHSITRKSTMSSLTIPFEQTFRDVDADRPSETQLKELDEFNFCGCGWPEHLLVPRGTTTGYPMILFAMITDYNMDRIDYNNPVDPDGCRTGASFCGLRDKKYPDARPMGFPFDRPPPKDVDNIQDFLTPNMAIKPITIFHSDVVKEGRLLSSATPTTPQSAILNNGS